MAFSPARLSYDDLRVRAEDFLDEFHDERTLPVPIEEIVEFDFQIEIIPIDGIQEDLDVDAFLTADLKRLYVDQFVMQHRRRRYRFSLAHELGHHELHRVLYMQSRINSIADWRALQESITEDAYAWFEYQAHAFAGLVLVPSRELLQAFEGGVKSARDAGMTDQTLWSEAGKTYLSKWLADQFDVSTDVIEKRLDKDRLWKLPDVPR